MKVLVFGGTGAMGTPLVRILAERGMEVYVTSRRPRNTDRENVHYLCGNAHDLDFVTDILKDGYDVLVDFMSYKQAEFVQRVHILLGTVKQYVFLSSCRVYAESETPITEETPRLLDVCQDKEYLATEEYALTKAREENILYAAESRNWTIVRPTLTYNAHRLQLGCYEDYHWLYRALHGRPIVFFEDLISKRTPMTYGLDVAYGISKLIGNPAALGETIQIATPETMTWGEVLQVYLDTLQNSALKLNPQIYILPHAEDTAKILGRKWQLKYNRIYNRQFDSTKMDKICGEKIRYTPMKEGLSSCLVDFLEGEQKFPLISVKSEAYMDKLTGCRAPLSEFGSWKNKVKYCVGRYTPYFFAGVKQEKGKYE